MSLNKKIKKRIKIILRIIAILLIILLATQLLATLIPSLMGYKTYAVLTPSMSPAVKTGSLVCVKQISAEKIRKDDICTFKSSFDKSKRFTHRVVSIDSEAQSFVTRGDNNPKNDPQPVDFTRLVGKVEHIIPLAGLLTLLTQKNIVKIISVLFVIFWLAVEIELLRRNKLKDNSTAAL